MGKLQLSHFSQYSILEWILPLPCINPLVANTDFILPTQESLFPSKPTGQLWIAETIFWPNVDSLDGWIVPLDENVNIATRWLSQMVQQLILFQGTIHMYHKEIIAHTLKECKICDSLGKTEEDVVHLLIVAVLLILVAVWLNTQLNTLIQVGYMLEEAQKPQVQMAN